MHHDAIQSMGVLLPLIAPRDPRFHLGVFVGRVIVGNQMERQLRRCCPVELFEKGQPLPMRVRGRRLTEDLPVHIGQCGKERDRPMSLVVVSLRAAVAAHDGKAGLCPFQGLTLALLITTQHQGPVRRIQIQANHVPKLLVEVLVRRELERAGHVGLDRIGAPEPLDGRLRDPRRLGHGAHRPARAMRRRLGRAHDNLLADLGGDSLLASPALGIGQSRQTRLPEPLFPLDDDGTAAAQLLRRLRLAETGGPMENDPRPSVVPMRRRRAVDNGTQRVPLFAGDA